MKVSRDSEWISNGLCFVCVCVCACPQELCSANLSVPVILSQHTYNGQLSTLCFALSSGGTVGWRNLRAAQRCGSEELRMRQEGGWAELLCCLLGLFWVLGLKPFNFVIPLFRTECRLVQTSTSSLSLMSYRAGFIGSVEVQGG